MSHTDVQAETPRKHEVTINILVNTWPVVLHERRPTGAEIKEAAIAQGADIKPTFQLILRRGQGAAKVIGDNEQVAIHDGDRFRAIPPDDNS